MSSHRNERGGRGGGIRGGGRGRGRGRGGSRSREGNRDNYTSHESPRRNSPNYDALMEDVSKGIRYFSEVTRSIEEKARLIGTKKDSRKNHKAINGEVEKGKNCAIRIKQILREISGIQKTPEYRRTANEYRVLKERYEKACRKVVSDERDAVDHIRRTSTPSLKPMDLSKYTEDQLYDQVTITNYDEDDLARREQDIIHISQQVNDVSAAFQEIDGLITEQGEVIIEVAQNTEETLDNTESAVEQLRVADEKTSYTGCSKRKCYCFMFLFVVVGILVGVLVLGGQSDSSSSN